jgi:hypothetical protein
LFFYRQNLKIEKKNALPDLEKKNDGTAANRKRAYADDWVVSRDPYGKVGCSWTHEKFASNGHCIIGTSDVTTDNV